MLPLGSSAIISTELNQPKPPGRATFSFKLPHPLRRKLASLEEGYNIRLAYPQQEGLMLLEELELELEQLNLMENTIEYSGDKLIVEQYRLAIIEAFEQHLHHLAAEMPAPPKKREPISLRILRRLGYGILLTLGLTLEGIGSFMGGRELIYLIPGISAPLALTINLGFSLINVLLCYYFEDSAHREAMGLDSMDKVGEHLQADEEEIVALGKINELMMSSAFTRFDQQQFSRYARFADRLNQTLQNKKQFQQDKLPEKTSRRILKYLLPVLSAAMMIVNSSLIFATSALLTSPLGWALLCFGGSAMLIYHLILRSKAIDNTLNPSIQKFKDVKNQFNALKIKNEADFILAYEKNKAPQEKVTLLTQLKDLKKENMALKGRLIEDTVRATFIKNYTETNSPSLWKKKSVSSFPSEASEQKKFQI